VIDGGVSFQLEPKPSPGHPPERDDPESLWSAYVAAAEHSKRTLALGDGLAAGRAYARFVQAFVEPNQRGLA